MIKILNPNFAKEVKKEIDAEIATKTEELLGKEKKR